MGRHLAPRAQGLGRTACLGVAMLASSIGCQATPDDDDQPSSAQEPVSSVTAELSAASAVPVRQSPSEWHNGMRRRSLPRNGCFRASYPATSWEEIPCVVAPNIPFITRSRAAPASSGLVVESVGSGTDFQASLANTNFARGSFLSSSSMTSETDSGTLNSNEYSVQINSNTFTSSPMCSGHASCTAWQQFVFWNSATPLVFMQYWLINYNAACPAGWTTFTPSAGVTDCYRNSTSAAVTRQSIGAFGQLQLTGTAGTQDTASIFTGNNTITVTGQDSVVSLLGAWNRSEFNVFGAGSGSAAQFNAGTTLIAELNVSNGTATAPTCIGGGTTGETNNLNLVNGSCCTRGGPEPAIVFTETNTGNAYQPFCKQMSFVSSLGALFK